MLVDSLSLDEPFDMGEYGGVIVEDARPLFARLLSAEVKGIYALQLEQHQVGVRLLLDDCDAFHFWVEDDELFWGDKDALAAHDWRYGIIPTSGERVQV